MMGILCAHMGRHDEAGPAIRRARELEPLLPVHQALSAQVAFLARDFAAAVQFAKQAIVVDPEFWIGYLQLGQAYEQSGEIALALGALSQAGRFGGANSKVIALRGYLFARLGRNQEGEEVLKTLKSVALERYVPPYAMALVHAGLGQQDAALEWLERGYNEHDVHLIFLPVDPKWDSFRTNGRFLALLHRCSFTAPAHLIS
jgi:tetratricopeptide (TPR) repeat protein